MEDWKTITILTFALLVFFGGGSIFITYRSKAKNAAQPPSSSITLTPTPLPTTLIPSVHPSVSPQK